MHVVTHALLGWSTTVPARLGRRDRGLVVLASVAPDLDAVAAVGDLVQGRALDSFELYASYHHVLGHNVLAAVLITLGCCLFARCRLVVGALAALAVHLHFLADVVGSRGPDGSQWEVPYLLPFSSAWQLAVDWQWALNAWPNVLLTVCLLALALFVAWSRGFSPVGLLSEKADRALVAALRQRFGQPPPPATTL